MSNNLKMKTVAKFGQILVRKYCSKENSISPKIKKLQQHFSVDDDVPIFLKGGFKDRILYVGTFALLGYGLAMGGYTAYILIRR